MFHIFANLCVLALSQKHGDDQILHDFATTYEIYIRVNNFTVYNTYSGMRDAWVRPNDWDEYTSSLKARTITVHGMPTPQTPKAMTNNIDKNQYLPTWPTPPQAGPDT